MDTSDLAQRALSGDETAFVAILEVFEQPLFAFFRRRKVPATRAEDLVQQVFVVFLESKGRYDTGAGSLRGYLFGIAWRLWARDAQQAARWPAALPADVASGVDGMPEYRVMTEEEIARVREAVSRLPEPTREVLNLRMYDQLPIAQIGRTLDMPVNTVKSHLHRARRMLAGQLADGAFQSEADDDGQ
jgi:RNA polymerase sigma-70 factor (ECF subfamily)